MRRQQAAKPLIVEYVRRPLVKQAQPVNPGRGCPVCFKQGRECLCGAVRVCPGCSRLGGEHNFGRTCTLMEDQRGS